MENYLLLRSEAEVRPPDELPEEVQDDGPEGAQTRDEVDGLGAQGDGGTMTVTTWSNYKTKHPMSEEAKAAYAKDREAMGVGYLVLKARAAAGMSQAQLARAIGTSQPTIARWESGSQVPSVRSMMKIAEATGFELALGLHRPADSARKLFAVEVIGRGRAKRGAA